MTWLIGKFRHTSLTLMMSSSPEWATKITSASGQAAIAASVPPGRGGSKFGISLAREARSGRPECSSRLIPCRHRPGVQLAPSGKMTSAPVRSSPLASCSICSVNRLSPTLLCSMNTLGNRFPSTSRLGSNCSAAFITTRGRRLYPVSSWWMSRNESPGPACRLSTMTGRISRAIRSAGVSSGSSTSTRSP